MSGRSRIEQRRARRVARKRSRRAGWDGWTLGARASDAPVGPLIDMAGIEDVRRAIEGLDDGLPWEQVRPRLLPLLERVRPYPAGTPRPLQALVPPGVTISLGIDVGPAFLHVTEQILKRWALPLADLVAQAVANVHARAAEIDPSEVMDGDIGGVPVAALQTGLGIGSTLILAPAELARIFGPKPRLFVAPMRDLIAGFPEAADDTALALYEEIAAQDPNHLHCRGFAFDGNRIRVRPLAPERTSAGGVTG